MKYFLGVDGGGTKTEAVLINEKREIIARGKALGSNANVLGLDSALVNLSKAIAQAVGNKRQIIGVVAIAGIDTIQDIKNWTEAFRKHSKLPTFFKEMPVFINDVKASLRSGTQDRNAIACIAGTGSNCWGHNEFGEEAKSGGQDYILSDEGSSYCIGSRILKSVTQMLDGRGPQTVLVNLLFGKFQINSLDELHSLVYKKPWDKIDIAQVAPLANKASKENDPVAIKIIEDAANELAIMGKAVVTKLKLKEKFYTAVLAGSAFNIHTLKEKLQQELLEFSPKVRFVEPSMSSAAAAAILALEGKF